MPILIDRAFSIVTDESAADGDFAERGMLAENEPVSFRELVELLRGGEASSYPTRGGVDEYILQDQGETRAFFENGEREERTIRYSRSNPPHMARYWRLAMVASGHVKGI